MKEKKKIHDEVKKYVDANLRDIDVYVSDEDYNHILDLAISVVLTRDEILQGGGFVQSIVKNDLSRAVHGADRTAFNAIKLLCHVNSWCFPSHK